MNSSKLYEVALGLFPGIGAGLTKMLVSYCGSAEKVFTTPKGKLKKIPGIGDKLAETIIQNRHLLKDAEKQLILAEKTGTKICFYTDQEYPARLKNINDAPAIIYYRGNIQLNPPKSIAIVGTRNASEYGKQSVDRIIEQLSPYRPTIVSGLAYGIDIAAHKAAIRNHLPTIGCMATGPDIVYPAVHKNIARTMEENGGILTECPFGKKILPSGFPARNRIIAGLCDVLIVIEAAKKGGALITAEMANDYNREVFALPGNVGEKYSEGCNRLIQQHKAHIFTDIDTLADLMRWSLSSKKETAQPAVTIIDLTEKELPIYTLLSNNATLQIDELSWRSNLPISVLASILLEMEFKGILKSMPGKRYKLA